MLRSVCGTIQLFPRLETDGNLTLAAQCHQFFDARPTRTFCNQYPIEGTAGAQGFPDGMDSYQRGHYDKGTSLMAAPS